MAIDNSWAAKTLYISCLSILQVEIKAVHPTLLRVAVKTGTLRYTDIRATKFMEDKIQCKLERILDTPYCSLES